MITILIILDTAYASSNPGMKRYTIQTLTSVTIPAGTTSIGYSAYMSCPITSIIIPSSVTRISNIISIAIILILTLIIYIYR